MLSVNRQIIRRHNEYPSQTTLCARAADAAVHRSAERRAPRTGAALRVFEGHRCGGSLFLRAEVIVPFTEGILISRKSLAGASRAVKVSGDLNRVEDTCRLF